MQENNYFDLLLMCFMGGFFLFAAVMTLFALRDLMKPIRIKETRFYLKQLVETPFEKTGIIRLVALDEEGPLYKVQTGESLAWYREAEIGIPPEGIEKDFRHPEIFVRKQYEGMKKTIKKLIERFWK